MNIVAGGAGFIGFNLVRHLLSVSPSPVIILDNFSNPNIKSSLLSNLPSKNLEIHNLDLSFYDQTLACLRSTQQKYGTDSITIWHLAANSDIPSGVNNPDIDLKDTFMTTFNLLKACKTLSITRFNFASSSAIYGDHGYLSLSETTSPLMPISNYGAMKLASESLCFAALEHFLDHLRIFRFPNVVGCPATHGVLFDFINKLNSNPALLSVLGDGTQTKSYLHVSDLVNALIYLSEKPLNINDNPIFNVGPNNDLVSVKWIAEEVCKLFSPNASIVYGSTRSGWKGDIPVFKYDTQKANSYGWHPSLTSKEAISKSIVEILQQTLSNTPF